MAIEFILNDTQSCRFQWVQKNVSEDEKNDVKAMWRQERSMAVAHKITVVSIDTAAHWVNSTMRQ